jgi:hypothetical protein
MKRFLTFLILALVGVFGSTSCEKDPTVPREVYAVLETTQEGGATSFFFLAIYDQNLAPLGGVGATGAESPIKKTGQTFTAMAGQELKINGQLFNSTGAADVLWSDIVAKVYVDGSVKWSKKLKAGDTFTPAFETLVIK